MSCFAPARYWLLTLLWGICLSAHVSGQDQADLDPDPNEIPLIEQEPFDLIQLDNLNGNVTIKIKPLEQPLREPYPDGYLVFEAPELSDDRLQVPYANIAGYRSYQDMLRAEANRFIRDEEYGKAFRNLIYVYDHGGKSDPRLTDLLQNLVFRDAAKKYLAEDFELALSMFQDIYERDKNFQAPGISKRPIDLILECLDKNIASKFEDQRYDLVRASIDSLELRYGEEAAAIAQQWRNRLIERSDELLNEARQIAATGNGQLAHLTARRANNVFPGRDEAIELFGEILARYPIVFVGTSQITGEADPTSLDNWSLRRIGRLTMRSVVEFVGPGDDGGKYAFPSGRIEQIDDNGFEFRFSIDPSIKGPVPTIDAYELSRRLLSRGALDSPEYYPPFARIVDTIEIEDANHVVVKLKIPFIRPEALFQFLYQGPEQTKVADGPYRFVEENEQFSIYDWNERYPKNPNAQHPQIVETRFATMTEAADALIGGEVDVVDRINPADVERLEAVASIKTGSYIVPTVHMLIPNERNDFMRDRTFRNGLKHAVNRDLILEQIICGGNEVNGCEVISGPFPIGTEENDQLSYAYNLRVLPEAHNERLGMVLARVVYETQVNAKVKAGIADPQVEFPKLVLACSADEIPQLACSSIQQMWASIGIEVILRILDDGEVVPDDDDWDFLYYEIAMQEPLVDVNHLFGREGIVQRVSAPVEQNLSLLGYADSWQRAARVLRNIHRQVVNDVAIIPLWQIKEHFAYRENLSGIGRNPVFLYENVANWQIDSNRSADE